MKLIPYLNFSGQAEAALGFYAAAGLGDVTNLSRFKDMPPGAGPPVTNPDHIMHGRITGPDGDLLMASDGGQADHIAGMSISVATHDLARAQTLFDALSAGGEVRMPLQRMFWGATFALLTDKFGVPWMINCETPA